MMFSLGAIVAPLIGGARTQNASWRWCFYINLPIGCPILIGIVAFFRPPNTAASSGKMLDTQQKIRVLDIPEAITLLGASTMLLMALQYGADDQKWSSPLVGGLLSGAAAATVVLSLWLWRKGDYALIPFCILKQWTVLSSVVANICRYAALVGYIYFLVRQIDG